MENTTSNMNQLVNVIVTYGYTAAEQDELSLRPGDIIRSVERLAGGWWKGELNGRTGLFPDNFVRVVGASQELSNDVTLRGSSISLCPRYCRALFSYQQANPDELSLAVGDIIQVLGEEEEGWWKGQLGNFRGVFPSNFVEPIDSSHAPPPVLPPKPVREQCRVIFPYTAANADELTLAEGDIVTILSKEVPDQGWWHGELRGRKGLFPDNFVQLIPLPVIPGGDSTSKKPNRPAKNIGNPNKSPSSVSRKDSTSSKSSVNSGQENVSSINRSLETIENNLAEQNSNKFKKSTESLDSSSEVKGSKIKKEADTPAVVEQKPRKSLEVDSGGGKPPIPSKKASSPVSAVLSGIKQRFTSSHNQPTPITMSADAADGVGSSKLNIGEPILRSMSPSPSQQSNNAHTINNNINTQLSTSMENFDQIERGSMLNDPRAGRVKAPRRRPPSQAMRDDGSLTNGNMPQPTPEQRGEDEIIKPKTKEWERHKAPWMEELKLNQAKKTSPIAEIGRSKTISNSDSTASDRSESHYPRLSGGSDKILDASNNSTNDDSKESSIIEMSQSMHALSNNAIKIEKSDEVQTVVENPVDLSKSMVSMSTKSSHLETNNKVSANELRTSISSSASVVLRSRVLPNASNQSTTAPIPSVRPSSAQSNASDSSSILNSLARFSVTSSEREHSTSEKTSDINSIRSTSSVQSSDKDKISHNVHSNGDISGNTTVAVDGTPEQILIAQLNERVANLEKVVEAQEERFSLALTDLKKQLMKETEMRIALQAVVQKLEMCVTNV